MYRFINRMASLVLAIGLLTGCSVFSHTSSPPKNPSPPANLSKNELSERLTTVNQQIDQEPSSADLRYRKGYILSELAMYEPAVEKRTSFYEEMHNSLKKAEALFNQDGLPSGTEKVNALLKVSWSTEHNQGVEILQSDSTTNKDSLLRAAAHFKNATAILPDTAISYEMEARAYYRSQDTPKAIQTLEEAGKHIETLPTDMLEQLAFLYLESGQTQKAISVYENAEAFSDDNLNLIHGLANAYISSGEHRKAVDLLTMLVDNKPNNIIYAQARANELYNVAALQLDSLIVNRLSQEEAGPVFNKADSLIHEAEQQFRSTLKQNSGDDELKQNVAYFYQNSSARYQKVLPFLKPEQKSKAEKETKAFLQSALPLFEGLTKQHPKQKELWSSLYQIYSYLNMNDKAQEAKSRIN